MYDYSQELSTISEYPASVTWLNQTEGRMLLQDMYFTSKFFPSGIITIQDVWFPYKITPENIRAVVQAVQVLITKNVCDDVIAVSFGDVIPNPIGNIYNLFFHGTSIRDLLSHIKKHLEHLDSVRDNRKDSFLFLHFPESMTCDKVKQTLNNYENFLKFTEQEITCVYSVDLSKYMTQSKL